MARHRHRQSRQWRGRNPLLVAVAAALLVSGLTLAALAPPRPAAEYAALDPPALAAPAPTRARAPLTKAPTSTPTTTRGAPRGAGMGPGGATARCRDDRLVYDPRPREHRACTGHGGIARVYD